MLWCFKCCVLFVFIQTTKQYCKKMFQHRVWDRTNPVAVARPCVLVICTRSSRVSVDRQSTTISAPSSSSSIINIGGFQPASRTEHFFLTPSDCITANVVTGHAALCLQMPLAIHRVWIIIWWKGCWKLKYVSYSYIVIVIGIVYTVVIISLYKI